MTTDLSRLSDGTYGRELGRVSPEGNIYGTTRWVRDVLRNFWWNGGSWLEIGEDIGQSNSVQLLPSTPQEPDTVWRCLDRVDESGRYVWKYFFWDAESQSWQPIIWYWTVDSVQELPNNPWFRGQAHEVKEPDVQAMWDGYTWRRIRISSFEDDIGIVSTLETYGGTLQGLSPEVELIYISPVELTLKPINSDFEYVTVNSIVIDSSKRTSVYSFSPVLDWWDETASFSTSLLQHSTSEIPEEYWVYLANKNDCFNLSTYDFRGRLFCSKTAPVNNRLGKFGTDAYNAIMIGRCQTAVPDDPSDRVEFLYELDVSLVSRAVDLKETFREFSDFDLKYVDETTLQLDRIYGTMGQIFIAGALYYLGENITVTNTDYRISVDGLGLLELDTSTISAGEEYYVYIASNSDIFNFNEINPETNMPWHPEDDGSGDGLVGPYYANMDLRLKVFLSVKHPEEGRLAETWRGYWARHIGIILTDGNGKFVYSSGLSAIRQPTLNPSYFDGLAEIHFVHVNSDSFKVVRNEGTSGVVIVGGREVQTHSSLDSSVHLVTSSDSVYRYSGNNDFPFLETNTVSSYVNSTLHVYLANDRPIFGGLSGKLFVSTDSPVSGYWGTNFPQNCARWIAKIVLDSEGKFSGTYVKDSVVGTGTTIEDSLVTTDATWSSYKIIETITDNLLAKSHEIYGLPILVEASTGAVDVSFHGQDNVSNQFATPVMTSNDGPSPCHITATYTNGSGGVNDFHPYYAFNQQTAQNYRQGWFTSESAQFKAICFDFGNGNTRLINKYRMQSIANPDYNFFPVRFLFQASNNPNSSVYDPVNSSNWLQLHYVNKCPDPPPGGWCEWQTFHNANGYRKYRLVFTISKGWAGYNQIYSISEIQLVEFLAPNNSARIVISPVNYDSAIIRLPSGNELVISNPIYANLQGDPGDVYYIYVNEFGNFYSVKSPPNTSCGELKYNTDGDLFLGYCSFSVANAFDGWWNVCSSFNEPERSLSGPMTIDSISRVARGFIVPPEFSGTITRDGETIIHIMSRLSNYYQSLLRVSLSRQRTYLYSYGGACWVFGEIATQPSATFSGINSTFNLWHSYNFEDGSYPGFDITVRSVTGNYYITRKRKQ